MDNVFFCVALGGAIFILIYGGLQIRRRYPLTRAELKSIKAGLKDVEAGRTKPIEQVRAEMRERERIRHGEACSDKSHWRN
jgi:hypothetical protein